jgi:TnpA family transposase
MFFAKEHFSFYLVDGAIERSFPSSRSDNRQNRLHCAFREIGRVVRTDFLLNWISDLELRRITIQYSLPISFIQDSLGEV